MYVCEKRNKAMDWSLEGEGQDRIFRDKTIIARINADDNIQSMRLKEFRISWGKLSGTKPLRVRYRMSAEHN